MCCLSFEHKLGNFVVHLILKLLCACARDCVDLDINEQQVEPMHTEQRLHTD